ncbi:hypothetical protein NDU88_004634 [Pleurodeles waltl]|uniref:Uncharacterized protein n=1 Tax=Pleurodeles waltl TaxID=8319 RepID=A0AAV7QIE6_PLEWA|nr:hypothetical protein NDU88_004634 [Pleurodeles waltl]
MGTPTDARCADFRIPSEKGTTDSGGDGKEFSRRTPPGAETQETPRQEETKADDAQGPGKDSQKERAETRRRALTATTLEGRGLTSSRAANNGMGRVLPLMGGRPVLPYLPLDP